MIHYVPKPLTEEVNVSKHSPLGQCALLLGVAAALIVLFYMFAGVLVDITAGYVPTSLEQRMGRLFDSKFPSAGAETERDRTEHLQALLGRLTPYLPGAGQKEHGERLDYTVAVFEDPTVNAAALPGGRIVFFSGLLDKLDTDDELMFVLAHELGHFHHHDHLRRMGRGMILLLVSSVLSSVGGEIPCLTANVVAGSMELAYSRKQERDADLFALDLLHKATGSYQGAMDFMRKLQTVEGTEDWLYFFATHPNPGDRLIYMREAAKNRS